MALSVTEIIAEAEAMTGLTDAGGDDHLTGLGVLLDAAAESPHRGPALDMRVRYTAVGALSSRLRSHAWWAARPDVLDRPLPPQVVVVGLPRSGTTALHQVLAADQRFQWIPAWLAPSPGPRPERAQWDADPRYTAAIDEYRRTGPNALHDIAPDDPEECLQLMRQSFVSMLWVSSQAVPAYHEWFIEQDERPSYRRFADNLKLMGADDPHRPWLLKNPSHTFGMAAMLHTFPDAVFVHIHRDPTESIVSGCSLIASMGLGDGTFTATELGAHRLRIWAMAADRFDAARDANPGRTVVDVDYAASSRTRWVRCARCTQRWGTSSTRWPKRPCAGGSSTGRRTSRARTATPPRTSASARPRSAIGWPGTSGATASHPTRARPGERTDRPRAADRRPPVPPRCRRP